MAAPKHLCIPLLSLLVLLLAYWFHHVEKDTLQDRLDTVLSSLLQAEQKVGLDAERPPRIAIGFGGCLDIIVDGVALMQEASIEPSYNPVHHNFIETETQLAESFAYFFPPGAASERYVSNETLFGKLVDASKRLSEMRSALGGNAPVMANRLAAEGCDVLLGGRLSTEEMSVLSERITENHGAVDLVSFSEKNKGHHTQKYIVHSDSHNPMIDSLEDFKSQLEGFDPDLVVIGGLQMMDSFPFKSGQREARLQALQEMLLSVDQEIGCHFEMASFVEQDLMRDLLQYVIPYSDSLGMNEQELPNLLSLIKGGNITVLSDPYPRVASILDQMRELYELLRFKEPQRGQRQLTRLHVHTLAFQAMMVTKGSMWKNTMSATAKASLTANRHVCGSSRIDTRKAKLIMDDSFSVSREVGSQRIPFQESRPVSCWEEETYEICLAPVLVCTEVFQTAGGGDNISAAGLVLQI
ncbi:unnamed protein product [Ranitomeya imitator]|uniref:ADP-dependent glucokinase n=1 Tax=Ranitomeya imitator TaxID=111125 RepID=A0ABN9L6L6_9NEOB|nr:unnamed protein product [Ranitomeya imitator]